MPPSISALNASNSVGGVHLLSLDVFSEADFCGICIVVDDGAR
jgi:hypothetical protein